jgi:hypothetical protein
VCMERMENLISTMEDLDTMVKTPLKASAAPFISPTTTHNPFIVARADSELIKDHNDIWNKEFSDWLTELITALQELHAAERREEVRPLGQ